MIDVDIFNSRDSDKMHTEYFNSDCITHFEPSVYGFIVHKLAQYGRSGVTVTIKLRPNIIHLKLDF